MSPHESLFELLNAVLAEGKALTDFISASVRSPGFDLATAKVCMDTNLNYLATVARMYAMLEAEPLDEDTRAALTDIVDVSHEHGATIRDLLYFEIRSLGGEPAQMDHSSTLRTS